MDVRQVRQFLAVVDTGSVHAAATQLLVAQPSVSQTLRRLEHELNTELFHRTGRRMVLTVAGRALVRPARDLVRALDVARATVESADGLQAGRLAISSMPSQAVHPLPALIGRFRDAVKSCGVVCDG
ncbi:LysR family transcriptional regulator [Pseudonocardia nantongensis]|uniref:LysR family transcriptional regulator n=1 Tax=Pseudonocardia nantongensis TaxID=1181885 RepID=UPI00397A5B0E